MEVFYTIRTIRLKKSRVRVWFAISGFAFFKPVSQMFEFKPQLLCQYLLIEKIEHNSYLQNF